MMAIGKPWKQFAEEDDQRFEDAKIASIDDLGVMIRHRNGSAHVRYGDLTEKQRVTLGLEEASALAANQEDRQRALAYETWVTDQMESQKRSKADLAKAFAAAQPRSRYRAPEISASPPEETDEVRRDRTRPLAALPRVVGRGNGSYPRYYRGRSSVYYYYNASQYYPSYSGVKTYVQQARPYSGYSSTSKFTSP